MRNSKMSNTELCRYTTLQWYHASASSVPRKSYYIMLDGSEKYPEHKDILTVAKAQSRISRAPYPPIGGAHAVTGGTKFGPVTK